MAARHKLQPKSGDPIVRKVFELVNAHGIEWANLEAESGVHRDTIRFWKLRRQTPSLLNARAVVEAIGKITGKPLTLGIIGLEGE